MTRTRLAGLIALSVAAAAPAIGRAQATTPAAPGPATIGGSSGSAGDYDRVAPKLPNAKPAPQVLLPAVTDPGPSDQTGPVLLSNLKGLVFLSGIGALQPGGVADSSAGPTGVAAGWVPLLADRRFEAQMRGYVGKPFTARDMQQVQQKTKAWLIAHRHPLVDVIIPPQNVSTGVVQVIVTEYRLGQVKVVGNRYFSSRVIDQATLIKPGQTVALDVLQAEVNHLNENPFLTVDPVFRPGAEPGTTDLELRAKDRLPVRVYAGYDNQGVRSLGEQEFNLGVNWGNAFGTGQILSYQYTRSFSGRFTSHSFSDVIPLPHTADRIEVFGSYARLVPDIAEGFHTVGHSGQASLRFVHILPTLPWLSGNVQVGYDYKSTDNNLEFLGQQVINGAADVHQFSLIYNGAQTDRYGQTTLENTIVYAPGAFSSRNSDAAFQLLTPGASAAYVYDRLSITRTTRLPANFTWVARGIAQRANAILPNSEQLGGGGVGSVRGYFPDTALGTEGELTNQEIRFPAFSPSGLFSKSSPIKDTAQAGLFFDYASLRQPVQVAGGLPSADLESTGVFLHYSVARFVDVNFDMGWQLRKAPNETSLGNYASVATIFSF